MATRLQTQITPGEGCGFKLHCHYALPWISYQTALSQKCSHLDNEDYQSTSLTTSQWRWKEMIRVNKGLRRQQSKCPFITTGMNKPRQYAHVMEYNTAVKKPELELYTVWWTDCQTKYGAKMQKRTQSMIPFLRSAKYTNQYYILFRNIDTCNKKITVCVGMTHTDFRRMANSGNSKGMQFGQWYLGGFNCVTLQFRGWQKLWPIQIQPVFVCPMSSEWLSHF